MKLSLGFLALTVAQDAAKDDGSDRWGYYDYHIPYDGKIGHAISGYKGGHEGNRRYCHATFDTVHIYRWDASIHGYFAHFNPVECVGEELFCHIEERAQFGQIIGIRAGCAQMMNHPQVSTAAPITLKPELKNHYNQEAARGATFQQTTNPVSIYYGIGGCLALPAQNGYDTHHSDWQAAMEKNYFLGTHGGYGQNQCLRFQRNDWVGTKTKTDKRTEPNRTGPDSNTPTGLIYNFFFLLSVQHQIRLKSLIPKSCIAMSNLQMALNLRHIFGEK